MTKSCINFPYGIDKHYQCSWNFAALMAKFILLENGWLLWALMWLWVFHLQQPRRPVLSFGMVNFTRGCFWCSATTPSALFPWWKAFCWYMHCMCARLLCHMSKVRWTVSFACENFKFHFKVSILNYFSKFLKCSKNKIKWTVF